MLCIVRTFWDNVLSNLSETGSLLNSGKQFSSSEHAYEHLMTAGVKKGDHFSVIVPVNPELALGMYILPGLGSFVSC